MDLWKACGYMSHEYFDFLIYITLTSFDATQQSIFNTAIKLVVKQVILKNVLKILPIPACYQHTKQYHFIEMLNLMITCLLSFIYHIQRFLKSSLETSIGKYLGPASNTVCPSCEVYFHIKGSDLILFLLKQDIATFERIRKKIFKLTFLLDMQFCALPFKENQV